MELGESRPMASHEAVGPGTTVTTQVAKVVPREILPAPPAKRQEAPWSAS